MQQPDHLTHSPDVTNYNGRMEKLKDILEKPEQELINVIGTPAVAQLKSFNGRLMFIPTTFRTLVDGNSVDSPRVREDHILSPKKHEYYFRSDFALLFDDWVVYLDTFTLHSDCLALEKQKLGNRFPKIIQIDFMLLEDFFSDTLTIDKTQYKNRKDVQELDGRGLMTSSARFLNKLKLFVRAIEPDCTVQIVTSDPQRERIYRIALKGLPNINFSTEKRKWK